MTAVNDIIQGVLLGGLFALFACGLSLLYGVVGVINLAHGDFAVLGAYIAVALIPNVPYNALWAVPLVIPIMVAVGYAMQRGVFARSLAVSPITTLLVTFGLSTVIENALLEGFSDNSHSLSIGSLVTSSFHIGSQISISYLRLGILVIAVLVLGGLQLMLSRTSIGRQIRAVSDDREAAAVSGIRTGHVAGIAAAIAFGTVALAGIAYGTVSQFNPYSGASLLLFSFEAVIIGGLGSLWGTLVGGMVLGVAQTLGPLVISGSGALAGHLVFLLILAVRPSGFLPAKAPA